MKVLVFNVDRWLSTARIPKALYDAGFEVGLLCSVESFTAKTKYHHQRYLIPSHIPQVVAQRFTEVMREWRPDLIVLGDETVKSFLQKVVLAAENGVDIGLDAESIEAVKNSLPRSSHFQASTDKFSFGQLARQIGVRVPESREIVTTADALSFAECYGYPVVLKNGIGTGGSGVSICSTEDELMQALQEGNRLRAMAKIKDKRISIERKVSGQIASVAIVAYKGKYLASAMCDKTECYPPITGPSTVRRYFDVEEVHLFARKVVEETGFSGFCGMDVLIESDSNLPFIIEWNARVTAPCSIGPRCGVDLCGALYRHMCGEPVPDMKVKEGWMIALYPQELIRDPDSKYVKEIYHDIPTDDPELLRAFEEYILEHRRREMVGSGRIV